MKLSISILIFKGICHPRDIGAIIISVSAPGAELMLSEGKGKELRAGQRCRAWETMACRSRSG